MFETIIKLFRWIFSIFGLYEAKARPQTTSFHTSPPLVHYPYVYTPPPYRLRDDFLSPAEFNFVKVLQDVVGDKAHLSFKVNLRDLFWVQTSDNSEFRTYTNKIDRKHVDVLLCHPRTLKPILGIELDDKSHARQDRQERDAFVDDVFESAGLPLLHISVSRGYYLEDLTSRILPYLEDLPAANAVRVNHAEPMQDKVCPKCGGEMVLRTAKKGKNVGQQFWGCSNYPQCRTKLAFEKLK